ncbi:MAG: SH3 domain-containing protein [Alphaproteobacteria bacterium]
MRLLAVIVAAYALAGAPAAIADDGAIGASGLKLPRFVTLGSDEVNLRTGPGTRYPKSWVFRRAGLPVMITAEHEYWRKVRDVDGAEGWVHRSLLSGRRGGLVVGDIATLRAAPDAGAAPVLRAEAGVVGRLQSCRVAWCEIEIAGRQGWLPRDAIFGVLPGEVFE